MQREHVPNGDGERPVKRRRIIAEETSTQASPEAADSFSALPPENLSQILSHLELKEIGRLSQTSTFWATLDWRLLIERDFVDIPMQTLARFAQLVHEMIPGLSISFANIYQCLRRLKKQAEKDKGGYGINHRFIFSCLQPRYHLSLLAICLNQSSATLLEKFIPRDEKAMWLSIAIFAHANNNLTLLNDINSTLPPETKNLIFYKICHSDNPLLASFLFDPIYHFNFVPERHEFTVSARAGRNRALLQTLIERFNFQIEPFSIYYPNQHLLHDVATSGNSETFHYLSAFFPFKSDLILLEAYQRQTEALTLNKAVASYNIELTEYLADNFSLPFTLSILNLLAYRCSPAKIVELIKKYDLTPNQETLHIIAFQADLNFLCNFITEYRLQPDHQILRNIARSGRFDVLRDFINRYGLTPDAETQQNACEFGNIEMIHYLAKTFNLAPDNVTIRFARYSDNWYQVIRYHLEQCRVMIDENRVHFCDEKTVLLYRAALAMQRAFSALPSRDFYVARTQLSLAAQYSPRHFFAVAVRAILSPAAYQLDAESVAILLNAMRSATTLSVSIMEASEIYSLLLDSCDERLQTLAEAAQPTPPTCTNR